MGGTSTISGGKLCLRIDPRVPTLSGCAASRGPTIKANTVPFSWIMASIHEGLVKDWQRTQLAGYISKSLQIMRLSCSERRLAPLDSWIGQSGLRSLDVLIDGRHGRHMTKQRTSWTPPTVRGPQRHDVVEEGRMTLSVLKLHVIVSISMSSR